MLPPLSETAKNFRFGVYEHYKGGQYRAREIAVHHDTLEEWVVYQGLYGDNRHFIRPLEMFLESVEIDGVVMPRFRYLGE